MAVVVALIRPVAGQTELAEPVGEVRLGLQGLQTLAVVAVAETCQVLAEQVVLVLSYFPYLPRTTQASILGHQLLRSAEATLSWRSRQAGATRLGTLQHQPIQTSKT